MESFSLLKYWRSGGGAAITGAFRSSTSRSASAVALRPSSAMVDDCGYDDDGPFFDLVFSDIPADSDSEQGMVNFELSSARCGGDALRSEGFSPSSDLFFNGKLVPLDSSSSIVIAASEYKPHFPAAALLKTATKFRVFLLRLRKPRPTATDPIDIPGFSASSPKPPPPQGHQSNFFVKFKAEEVPLISFFIRDGASRKHSPGCLPAKASAEDRVALAEERRFAGEVVQKYLSAIKPLYVRVSRYGEKLRLPGEPMPVEEAADRAVAGIGKGLKVGGRRLGKSRPQPATVAAVRSPPGQVSQRRDDSLWEQQDGIQSAIAHCKRSLTDP